MRERAVVEALEGRRLLAVGLDPTFGVGGLVVRDVLPDDAGPGPDEALAVLPLPGGKVISVAGTVLDIDGPGQAIRAVLTRFNANGSVDTTYGLGGVATISPAGWGAFGPADAELLSDGSVLVMGTAFREPPPGQWDNEFAHVLQRVLPDGRLGALTLNPDNPRRWGESQMVRQPDGKIVITEIDHGSTQEDGDDDVVLLRRLNADGTPDLGFGNAGRANVPTQMASTKLGIDLDRISFRPDGRIILASRRGSGTTSLLAQLNANGSVDTSFGGGDGIIEVPPPGWHVHRIEAAPGGGFYASAWRSKDPLPIAIVKLTETGQIDPTFTISRFPAGARADSVRMLVQPDGKVFAAAQSEDFRDTPERMDPIFLRVNTDGTLDATFGNGGSLRLITDQENKSVVRDIARAADGDLYAAGGADGRMLTLRLADDPLVPPTPAAPIVALNGDRLDITGTAGRDVIVIRSVGGNVEVTANGVVKTFAAASVKRIAAFGDAGPDLIDARDLAPIVTTGVDHPVTIDGAAGADVLVGSQGRDRITGGNDFDKVHGWDGDDWCSGNAQKDRVDGGRGNDSVLGNGSRDTLHGDVGNDSLFGGDQPDVLLGADGDDLLMAEGGHDRISGGAGIDQMHGGGGNDTFFARDGERDHLVGGRLATDIATVDEEDEVISMEQVL